MKLLEKLLAALPTEPVAVRKVLIGIHWTLVCSRYAGLSSTLIDEGAHGHAQLTGVGALHQKSAQELAHWALSDNPLEASIGVAALNSLLEIDQGSTRPVNAAEVIAQHCRGRNLAIVGHFPFVERMKNIACNCWVIEKRPVPGDFLEERAPEWIPQADVVAITGTALINHTLEGLLSLCRPQALVMILGPSTPLAPILFDAGVSFLSGARVVDEEAAALTIQQGAIFPQVKGVQLMTLTRGDVMV